MEKGQSQSSIAWFSSLDAKAICVALDAIEFYHGIVLNPKFSIEGI